MSLSKLCSWNIGRTLVLLLKWCDRTQHFSGLFPLRRVIGLHSCTHITRIRNVRNCRVNYTHAWLNYQERFLFNVYKRILFLSRSLTFFVLIWTFFYIYGLSVCTQHYSKTNDPKVFKGGIVNDLFGISHKWHCFRVSRSQVIIRVIGLWYSNTAWVRTLWVPSSLRLCSLNRKRRDLTIAHTTSARSIVLSLCFTYFWNTVAWQANCLPGQYYGA